MATVQIEPVSPPDDTPYEVVDGERVELPPMGAIDVFVVNRLYVRIANHVNQHSLGEAVTEMLFRLDPDRTNLRRPDIAFVSTERWRKVARGNAWHVVPDLAVEVVSPTDYASELLNKVDEYFQAGVRRVWAIFPEQGRVQDFESPLVSKWYGVDEPVPGGDLLPGFSFRLEELL